MINVYRINNQVNVWLTLRYNDKNTQITKLNECAQNFNVK